MPASLVKQSIVAILRILKQHPEMQLKTKMILTRRLEKLHVWLEQEKTELLLAHASGALERAQIEANSENETKQPQSSISDTKQSA
jgi:hypothetical protein